MSIILVAVVCMGMGGDVCRIDYIPTDSPTTKHCEAISQATMAKELKLESGERLYSFSCQEDKE